LREIAEEKMEDLNSADIEAAMRVIAGTARSCGIEVEEEGEAAEEAGEVEEVEAEEG
jgi:hypothetical protein